MQRHYEHSLPKVKTCESKRKVLVFRHGIIKPCKDNGKQASSKVIPHHERIWYGHPQRETGIIESLTLHSRAELSEYNVHE